MGGLTRAVDEAVRHAGECVDFMVTELLPLIPTFRPVTAVFFLPSFPESVFALHFFFPLPRPPSIPVLFAQVHPGKIQPRCGAGLLLHSPLKRLLADGSSRGGRRRVFKGALYGCHAA